MTITVQWYERKPDRSPDYNKNHVAWITRDTAAECMDYYHEYIQFYHDVWKYTITEIVNVED